MKLSIVIRDNQEWWHMPVIPRKRKQKDWEFKAT